MGSNMRLSDCIRLAEFAHFNQSDKSGADYIEHPKRVLASVQAQGAMPHVQMAAVLHDVTEDTKFTPEMLLALDVPWAAVEIVSLLDRNISRVRYQSWYNSEDICNTPEEFYYFEIRENAGARKVKLADIADNLEPWRLAYLPELTQERLRSKYARGIELLS